ncbi:MAG: hypothetical protein A4S09_01030 [Proteobacteria bacterium SG_bin7]|nr:MAG: hypothetical protein A4S09_01030 [Proteobacteria bacterium SG_bin7]
MLFTLKNPRTSKVYIEFVSGLQQVIGIKGLEYLWDFDDRFGEVIMPSGSHLLVLAILMILLFGGRKLPELGRGLGEAIRSFKKGLNEDEIDVSQNKREIEKDKNDKA